MGAPETLLKSPSRGRSWEGEKNKAAERFLKKAPQVVGHEKAENIRITGNFFFCGINFDANARFGLWTRHQKWCHSTEIHVVLHPRLRFGANFLTGSSRGSDSEPNFIRKLLSPPYRNLWASKTTLISEISWKIFWAWSYQGTGSLSSTIPSTPLPQHRRPKNDIVFEIFWKNFRNISFADKGRCSRLSPLNPLQQHEGPKNDTDFQKIFLYSCTARFWRKK